MRIGLSFAALVNKGGIGRYVRILARELPVLFPEHSYVGYVPEFRARETSDILESEKIAGWEIINVPSRNRWAFETSALSKILSKNPPDIFHGPDYLAPKAPCPVCVTVHDLAFRLHPGGMALKSWFLFRFLTPGSVDLAAKTGQVFCDSQATLDDLRKLKWIEADKGKVVHLACEDEFREPVSVEKIECVLDKYLLPDIYSLYVGPIEKRKNLGLLIDAYNLVGMVLQRRDELTPSLIAVGPIGAGGKKLLKSLEKSSQGRFHHLGYIPREDLPA
ncbi:MAG: glycosyltransferase, partial [bacterium]|nr:glycosyltransferase [bacterium]